MAQQRACTLTFKSSDSSTHTIQLPLGAPVTPDMVIKDCHAAGGFWAGGTWAGVNDPTGVATGSVWVCWEQVVSVTIS